jgi:septal ring factor EnvC (AmiA/AmiB activator)
MTSSRLLAVGMIISVLLVVWWFASGLARRLERLEQTLSVVQVMQQQLQRSFEHRESMEDVRARIDRLEPLLVGEMKSTADQGETCLEGLAQQLSVLEGRLDSLKDQLDIIESLLEGDDRGQRGDALGATNRRP